MKIKEDRVTRDDATRIDDPFKDMLKGDMTKFEGRTTDFWKDQQEIIELLKETNPGKFDIQWESLLIDRYIFWKIMQRLDTIESTQENMNRIINEKEEMYRRGPSNLR